MNNTPSQNTMLELYKLHAEMADRISQRRRSANNYFLAINTTLISLVIASLAYSRFIKDTTLDFVLCVSFSISVVGIVNCRAWYALIMSYKSMNSAKYKVIHKMEEIIGYRPYFDEWELLKRGEDKEVYEKFTVVESRVPRVLCLLYMVAMVVSISWWLYRLFAGKVSVIT